MATNQQSSDTLTASEREALARITGGHVVPFNHHPCITCAIQTEVARIMSARMADMDWYVGKVPGYHDDLSAEATRAEHVVSDTEGCWCDPVVKRVPGRKRGDR